MHLSDPLLAYLKRLLPMDVAHHRDMVQGLGASAGIEHMVRRNKTKPQFSDEDAILFRKLCFRFCQCQDALIRHFHPTPLFDATVKSNYICHLGIIAQYVNVALGSCWAGEDLMQVVRRLVQSSLFGVSPAKRQVIAMRKYVRAMDMELSVKFGSQ